MLVDSFDLLEENSTSDTSRSLFPFPDEKLMVEGIDESDFPQNGFLPEGGKLVIANRGEDFDLYHSYEALEDFDLMYDPTSEFYLVGESLIFGVGPSPIVVENSDDRIKVEIQL